MTRANDPRTDEALVAIINGGGSDAADAFEALYRRHRDWVVNLAHRYTRDSQLALDVMQETFIYLLGKFDRSDASEGTSGGGGRRGFVLTAKMTTFLFPVVRHIAIRQRDKARRAQGDTELTHAATQAEPQSVATDSPETEPSRDALAHVLASLPEAQRECVLLRFVDGFTLDEIAAAMHIPTGTVKSRLHHALRTLREDPKVRDYFAPD